MQRYRLSGYPPNVFRIIFENRRIIDINQGLKEEKGLYRRDRRDRHNRQDRHNRKMSRMGTFGQGESRMGRGKEEKRT